VHAIVFSDTVPRTNYDNHQLSPSNAYLSLEEMPTPIYENETSLNASA